MSCFKTRKRLVHSIQVHINQIWKQHVACLLIIKFSYEHPPNYHNHSTNCENKEKGNASLQLQLVVSPPWLLQRGQSPWPVPAVAAVGLAAAAAGRREEEETQRRRQRSHLWARQATREKKKVHVSQCVLLRMCMF